MEVHRVCFKWMEWIPVAFIEFGKRFKWMEWIPVAFIEFGKQIDNWESWSMTNLFGVFQGCLKLDRRRVYHKASVFISHCSICIMHYASSVADQGEEYP